MNEGKKQPRGWSCRNFCSRELSSSSCLQSALLHLFQNILLLNSPSHSPWTLSFIPYPTYYLPFRICSAFLLSFHSTNVFLRKVSFLTKWFSSTNHIQRATYSVIYMTIVFYKKHCLFLFASMASAPRQGLSLFHVCTVPYITHSPAFINPVCSLMEQEQN